MSTSDTATHSPYSQAGLANWRQNIIYITLVLFLPRSSAPFVVLPHQGFHNPYKKRNISRQYWRWIGGTGLPCPGCFCSPYRRGSALSACQPISDGWVWRSCRPGTTVRRARLEQATAGIPACSLHSPARRRASASPLPSPLSPSGYRRAISYDVSATPPPARSSRATMPGYFAVAASGHS